MKRKLIKQGGGGFTVYLPKKWIDERSLKAGDEIDVDETDNALVLRTKANVKKSTTLALIDEPHYLIYLKLTHLYRMGFDTIYVTFKNSSLLAEVQRIVTDYLLGFEITEKQKNSCILENVAEPADEKFSALFRRIFLQIKEMHALITDDVVQNKQLHKQEIQQLRISFDKHVYFCRRCISKKMNIEEDSILHWELLTLLTHTQHGFYYLYQYYADKKKSLSSETKHFLSLLENYFDCVYNAYFEKKSEYLDTQQKLYHHLNTNIFVLLEKNKDAVVLAHLKEIIRLIQVAGSPVRALLTDVQSRSNLE
jgi:phosphate uptake regulator